MTTTSLPTSNDILEASFYYLKHKFVPQNTSKLLKDLVSLFFNEQNCSNDGQSTIREIPHIKKNFHGVSDVVVMVSGGAGSTATLWKALSTGKNPAMLYFSGVYSGSVLEYREKSIESLALGSRNSEGKPLATPPEWTTWLSTLEINPPISDLPRRAKIGIMIAHAKEAMSGEGDLPHLAWGPMNEFKDTLEFMKPWGFTHICPFSDLDEAMMCLTDGEVTSDVIFENHGGRELFKFTPGAVLPTSCTNIVCSCWDPAAYSSFLNKSNQPDGKFDSMCKNCLGCKRWLSSLESITKKCPRIWIGSRTEGSSGEQEWRTLPSLHLERKINSLKLTPGNKTNLSIEEDEEDSDEDTKDKERDEESDDSEYQTSEDDETIDNIDEEDTIETLDDEVDNSYEAQEVDYSAYISDDDSDYESSKRKKRR